MDESLPETSLAEILADKIAALDPARLPAAVRRKCEDLAVDVVGLCLTALNAAAERGKGHIASPCKASAQKPCFAPSSRSALSR